MTPASVWHRVCSYGHVGAAPEASVRMGHVDSKGVTLTRLKDAGKQLQASRGAITRAGDGLEVKSPAGLVRGSPGVLTTDAGD